VNLSNRRTLLIFMSVAFVLLFAGGIAAAILSRNEPICSDGKVPLAQRGGMLGQTEYLCHNGQVVTK
jgi:hypothetical protein